MSKTKAVLKEMACMTAAKGLVMSLIDLLADGAQAGLAIKRDFVAPMTKAEYLAKWGRLEEPRE